MPTLAVYFDQPGEMDYPFTDPLYLQAHQRFALEMAKDNVSVVVVRGEDSHLGGTTFSHYWKYTETGVQRFDETITADLIYNKCVVPIPDSFPEDKTFNYPALDKICHDKMVTFELFGEFMPKSLHITRENWKEVISQLRTEMVTLKPLEGESGYGIHFLKRNDFNGDSFDYSDGYLAQEFIDTSTGIPNITPGRHDLRILVFGGVPKLAVIRIPAPGKLLANVAQGATTHCVDLNLVPKEVLEIVAKVDEKLKQFSPRIYSVDFLIAKEGPFIVELNSRPGFPHPDRQGEAYVKVFFDSHREIFKSFFATK